MVKRNSMVSRLKKSFTTMKQWELRRRMMSKTRRNITLRDFKGLTEGWALSIYQ